MAKDRSHEEGYRAFEKSGLGARNPYSNTNDEESAWRWSQGWEKARQAALSHRPKEATDD